MDLEQEELESLALTAIVRESVQIPRSSPRTFALLTLAFIFPLSFAVLAHPLLTHPLLLRLLDPASASSSSSSSFSTSSALSLLLFYQFAYLLFLFVFSLLSTAALVFTVASLYAAKPVSFSSSLAAVPPILPRLFSTFLWVFLLLLLYNLAFAGSLLALLSLFDRPEDSPTFLLSLLSLLLFFLLAHVYVSALWHLASVVSVLEPIQGHAAMSKAYHLLRGKTATAGVLIAAYLGACGTIGSLFRMIVVAGGDAVEDEYGRVEGPMVGLVPRIAFGAALVAVLVVVNLVGLLVQSVFYHVCKSYHHQGIDKRSLYDHLGGYLGEYAPLKSSIQMETF